MQARVRGWWWWWWWWVASLPLLCPGLAIRADSQVPALADDPRLSLADAQLAPAAPRAGRGGGDVRAAATLKQDHRISRCGICYNINASQLCDLTQVTSFVSLGSLGFLFCFVFLN